MRWESKGDAYGIHKPKQQQYGEDNHRTIYSDDTVRQIRELRANGVRYKAISELAGVNYWTARKIGSGGRRSEKITTDKAKAATC